MATDQEARQQLAQSLLDATIPHMRRRAADQHDSVGLALLDVIERAVPAGELILAGLLHHILAARILEDQSGMNEAGHLLHRSAMVIYQQEGGHRG